LEDLPIGNIGITQIQLRVTFGPAGASSSEYLTFYKATSNTISGSTSSMRGASIGAVSVSKAYDRTVTLTFNEETNPEVFSGLSSHFLSGNRVLIIYVSSTRGTHSGGYCYDYLTITSAALNITYEYLQSDGA
jgi:hypothetical protein